MTQVYAYVFYGKGGWFFSMGMGRLAERLGLLSDRITVKTETWKYCLSRTVPTIKSLPETGNKIILIGFSLGGNAVLDIANALPHRQIDLAVAYDPSIYAVPQITKVGPNVKRCLCFHNNGTSPYGHAQFTGPQVETTIINEDHLNVDNDEVLHRLTIAAVLKVICG